MRKRKTKGKPSGCIRKSLRLIALLMLTSCGLLWAVYASIPDDDPVRLADVPMNNETDLVSTPGAAPTIPSMTPIVLTFQEIERSAPVILESDLTFVIDAFQAYAQIGDFVPSNNVLLVILGKLANVTDTEQCAYARDVKLVAGSYEYVPDQMAMRAAKNNLYPDIDYVGPLNGQCVEAGDSESTFLVFDLIEENLQSISFGESYAPVNVVVPLPSATMTFTPGPTDTPRPTSQPQPTITPEFSFSYATMYVNSSSRVNIRSCASTDCEIITTADSGEQLQVYNTENSWHQIRMSDGQIGYVYAPLTSHNRPSPPSSDQQSAGYTCDCNKTCSMLTCSEAYFQLQQCGCRARDGDGDGIPCDSKCQ